MSHASNERRKHAGVLCHNKGPEWGTLPQVRPFPILSCCGFLPIGAKLLEPPHSRAARGVSFPTSGFGKGGGRRACILALFYSYLSRTAAVCGCWHCVIHSCRGSTALLMLQDVTALCLESGKTLVMSFLHRGPFRVLVGVRRGRKGMGRRGQTQILYR
jgi:hypothetical protein